MKRLLILLMLMIPSWAQAQTWGQQPPARSAPTVDPKAVSASVLIVSNKVGLVNMGSGTCIAVHEGRGLVLTAKHVTAGAKTLTIQFPSKKTYYANVLAVDDKADLAALEFTADGTEPFIPLATQDARPGETIWLAGYPAGHGPRPRTGKVVGYNGFTSTARVLNLNVWSDHGDSGGGVFRPDNTLVGVLWGGNDRNKQDTQVTGLADVQRFVNERCGGFFQRFKPRVPVVTAGPQSPPSPAPAIPAGPGVPPPLPADPGLSALREQLAQALADIETLKARAPQNGKDGPPGRDGKDSQPGKDGRDGKDADTAGLLAELAALKKLIAGLPAQPASNPPPAAPGPVRVRVVPAEGN